MSLVNIQEFTQSNINQDRTLGSNICLEEN